MAAQIGATIPATIARVNVSATASGLPATSDIARPDTSRQKRTSTRRTIATTVAATISSASSSNRAPSRLRFGGPGRPRLLREEQQRRERDGGDAGQAPEQPGE